MYTVVSFFVPSDFVRMKCQTLRIDNYVQSPLCVNLDPVAYVCVLLLVLGSEMDLRLC